ncbi:MAG: hypothetical protein JWO36_6640, partial [Myxococcales bacterium]|nr:hypothetical protein [Myxococcales bacterium]
GKRDEFNAPMVDALAKCGLLQVGAVPNSDSLPSLPSPPDPNIGKRCIVEHADVAGHTELGTCRELSTCTTYYYQGACTGDANIICCIDKRI